MTSAVTITRHGGTGGTTAVAARARQVVKAYGSGETRVVALDQVDVDIARGQFTAIMGPSGSGKSTLMHCLAGLDTVTSGQVRLGDTEITGLKDKQLTQLRRDRIGFIFQAFNLLPTLNAAGEHHAADGHRRPQARQAVAGPGHRHRRPRATGSSTGRPSSPAASSSASPCARALASRPEIIFGDEPTGNLDSRAGAEVLGFLRELGRRARPDRRHGHPRPGRRLLRGPGASSSPTAGSSTRCTSPTAEAVLDRMKDFDAPGADVMSVL